MNQNIQTGVSMIENTESTIEKSNENQSTSSWLSLILSFEFEVRRGNSSLGNNFLLMPDIIS